MAYGPLDACPGHGRGVGRSAVESDPLDDLRVQVVNHRDGQRSHVVLDVSSGVVHRRAEGFLAGFGEGTQRTYAYHLVDHLRWLAAYGYREDTVGIGDLRRYMALCGVEFTGPLGTPWRATPLSENAQQVRAACVKGYYLDLTTREDVNEPLRAALSAPAAGEREGPGPLEARASDHIDGGEPLVARHTPAPASAAAARRGRGRDARRGADGTGTA